LFNRHGFNAVSIDDVMAEAGLTRGNFYCHFTSKSDLYAQSVARIVHEDPEGANGAGSGRVRADRSFAIICQTRTLWRPTKLFR